MLSVVTSGVTKNPIRYAFKSYFADLLLDAIFLQAKISRPQTAHHETFQLFLPHSPIVSGLKELVGLGVDHHDRNEHLIRLDPNGIRRHSLCGS